MAKCDYCGTSIVFGGVRADGQRFCNSRCQRNGYILNLSKNLAPDVVDREVENVWRGNCPECRGLGPVDVHRVHRVWSALVLTSWSSKQKVCCRSCARKGQLGGILFSLVLGWWGFPWGLVLTPVQIGRNVAGMFGGPKDTHASADLRKLVMVNLGAQMISANQQRGTMPTTAQPPPLPVPSAS